MHPPAMLKKIVEPAGSLYMIKSVSDEEIEAANSRFVREDQPFRIVRLRGQAA